MLTPSRANACWKPVTLYSLGKGESKAMVFSSWKRAPSLSHFFGCPRERGWNPDEWWWQLHLELSPGGIHSNTQVGFCRLSLLTETQSSPPSFVPRKICTPSYGVCRAGSGCVAAVQGFKLHSATRTTPPGNNKRGDWRPAQVLLVESNQGHGDPFGADTLCVIREVCRFSSGT
jgi:hypothetical protein